MSDKWYSKKKAAKLVALVHTATQSAQADFWALHLNAAFNKGKVAMTADSLARLFHYHYERLAPAHGWATNPETCVPWEDVPERNKSLMLAVAEAVLVNLEDRPCKCPAPRLGFTDTADREELP